MSSNSVTGCAACIQNQCTVHNVYEQVTPYTLWTPFDLTYSQTKVERHSYDFMQKLNRDRKEKQISTDGILQVENKTFAVHKSIIGAMSVYFQKMFLLPMQERWQNVAKISGITPRRLERILEYIYTGYTGFTDENVCMILVDAAYVQVTDLEKKCIKYMEHKLKVDNCLLFRAYAKLYDIQTVVNRANFIISANTMNVLHHRDFEELYFDDVQEILEMFKDQTVDEEILACCENWFNYEREERNDQFTSLLDLIDFSFLSSSFINERIQSEEDFVLHPQYNERLHNELSARVNVKTGRSDLSYYENSVVVIGEETSWIMNIRTQEKNSFLEPIADKHGASWIKDGQMVLLFGGGRKLTNVHAHIEEELWRRVQVLDLSGSVARRQFPCLTSGRRYAACTMLNGNYYISGGEQRNDQIIETCECYYFFKDEWVTHSKMNDGRRSHGMVVLNGSLYVLGGWNKGSLASVERYDQSNEKWVLRSPMLEARISTKAVVLNNTIFALGGSILEDSSKVQTYSESADQWTWICSLHIRRIQFSVLVFYGQIFVLGGIVSTGAFDADKVECYDPRTEKWSIRFYLKIPTLSFVFAI